MKLFILRAFNKILIRLKINNFFIITILNILILVYKINLMVLTHIIIKTRPVTITSSSSKKTEKPVVRATRTVPIEGEIKNSQ